MTNVDRMGCVNGLRVTSSATLIVKVNTPFLAMLALTSVGCETMRGATVTNLTESWPFLPPKLSGSPFCVSTTELTHSLPGILSSGCTGVLQLTIAKPGGPAEHARARVCEGHTCMHACAHAHVRVQLTWRVSSPPGTSVMRPTGDATHARTRADTRTLGRAGQQTTGGSVTRTLARVGGQRGLGWRLALTESCKLAHTINKQVVTGMHVRARACSLGNGVRGGDVLLWVGERALVDAFGVLVRDAGDGLQRCTQ